MHMKTEDPDKQEINILIPYLNVQTWTNSIDPNQIHFSMSSAKNFIQQAKCFIASDSLVYDWSKTYQGLKQIRL